jgi:CDP-diacylglycerol--glycerol-3-phosphate 3-phosphatidyltransferase
MKKEASPYNPANLISLIRVLLAPVFVIFMHHGREGLAVAVFIVASLSDFADGYLARRFQWRTRLGEFIDPLGDKLLTLAAFVMLNLEGRLAFWVTVTAFAREIVVVTGYVLLAVLARMTALKVSLLGKAGTLFQMLALGFFLAARPLEFGQPLEKVLSYLLAVAVLLNFLSGLDYAARGIQDFEKTRKAPKV